MEMAMREMRRNSSYVKNRNTVIRPVFSQRMAPPKVWLEVFDSKGSCRRLINIAYEVLILVSSCRHGGYWVYRIIAEDVGATRLMSKATSVLV